MPSRTIRWGQRHVMESEVPFPQTIAELWIHTQVGGTVDNEYLSLGLDEWEKLAEHILSERDRREAEAAKQPKRWLVDVIAEKAFAQEDDSRGRAQAAIFFRANRDEAERLYVWAKDEKDAIQKAKEANHSLGVWIREYLA